MNQILLATKQRRGKGTAYSLHKKEMTREIQLLALAQRFPEVETPAWFTYLHFERKRTRDPSNFAMGAQKVIEDGLQGGPCDTPYLRGDGWKHVLGFIHYWNLSSEPGVFLAVCEDKPFTHEEVLAVYRSRRNKA